MSSCSDGVRSASEDGVDCGGVCDAVCGTQHASPRVPVAVVAIGVCIVVTSLAVLTAYRMHRSAASKGVFVSSDVLQPVASLRGDSGRGTGGNGGDDVSPARSRRGKGAHAAPVVATADVSPNGSGGGDRGGTGRTDSRTASRKSSLDVVMAAIRGRLAATERSKVAPKAVKAPPKTFRVQPWDSTPASPAAK
jgi:hypothetical protein